MSAAVVAVWAAESGFRDILEEEKGRRKRARKEGMWAVIAAMLRVRSVRVRRV